MEPTLAEKVALLEREVAQLKNEIMRNRGSTSKVETSSVWFKSRIGFFGKQPIDQPAAISSPTGGVTIDSQARTAIDSIRTTLQNLGLTA